MTASIIVKENSVNASAPQSANGRRWKNWSEKEVMKTYFANNSHLQCYLTTFLHHFLIVFQLVALKKFLDLFLPISERLEANEKGFANSVGSLQTTFASSRRQNCWNLKIITQRLNKRFSFSKTLVRRRSRNKWSRSGLVTIFRPAKKSRDS